MEVLSFIWSNAFYNPILNILVVLYEIGFQNLGLAVILLTLIVRLLTIPLTQNQIENSQKLQEIRPELQKLQKKYSKDPLKFQQKQRELYQRVGYQPIGCFTSLVVQIPIIIALYTAVRRVSEGDLEGIYTFVANTFNIGEKFDVHTGFFIVDLAKSYNNVAQDFGRFSVEVLPYFGLAVLVAIVQYIATRFVTGSRPKPPVPKKKSNKKQDEVDPSAMMESMNKSMLVTMPLIIGFTSLSLPSVLSVYWIMSSVMQITQQLLVGDREYIFKKVQTRYDEVINHKPKSDI